MKVLREQLVIGVLPRLIQLFLRHNQALIVNECCVDPKLKQFVTFGHEVKFDVAAQRHRVLELVLQDQGAGFIHLGSRFLQFFHLLGQVC